MSELLNANFHISSPFTASWPANEVSVGIGSRDKNLLYLLLRQPVRLQRQRHLRHQCAVGSLPEALPTQSCLSLCRTKVSHGFHPYPDCIARQIGYWNLLYVDEAHG